MLTATFWGISPGSGLEAPMGHFSTHLPLAFPGLDPHWSPGRQQGRGGGSWSSGSLGWLRGGASPEHGCLSLSHRWAPFFLLLLSLPHPAPPTIPHCPDPAMGTASCQSSALGRWGQEPWPGTDILEVKWSGSPGLLWATEHPGYLGPTAFPHFALLGRAEVMTHCPTPYCHHRPFV